MADFQGDVARVQELIKSRMGGERSDLAKLSAKAQDLRSGSRALLADLAPGDVEVLATEGLDELKEALEGLVQRQDVANCEKKVDGGDVPWHAGMVKADPRTIALELGGVRAPIGRMHNEEMRDLVAEVDDLSHALLEDVDFVDSGTPDLVVAGTPREPAPAGD